MRFRAPCERCVSKQSQGCQILCMQATLPPPSKSTFFAVPSLCSLPPQEAPWDRLSCCFAGMEQKSAISCTLRTLCIEAKSRVANILHAGHPPPSLEEHFLCGPLPLQSSAPRSTLGPPSCCFAGMEQKSAISCTLRTLCTEAKSRVANILHAGHPPPSLEEHFLCGPLPLQSSAPRSTL